MTFGIICRHCRKRVTGMLATDGFQSMLPDAVTAFGRQQCAQCRQFGFTIWLDGDRC